MPPLWVIALSILSYACVGICLYLFRHEIHWLFTWPTDPLMRRMWIMWLVFLAIFAPLSEYPGDMQTWVDGARYTVAGKSLPFWYVYLPIYAQFLAGLWLPFSALSPVTAKILLIVEIHTLVLFGYTLCAALMARLAPKRPQIAVLGVAGNPMVILNLFQGQNHILMLACLLAAIWLIRQERWLWAGFWLGIGCYKFMLIPSAALLTLMVLHRYRWRAVKPFVLGAAVSLIPSAIYYAFHMERLIEIVTRFGSIGAHANVIEPYHFLFIISNRAAGFGEFYLQHNIWLIIVIASAAISGWLYWRGKLNSLQTLGIVEAVICLAAPEPFHLEPMIGLLWLDATRRRDVNLQSAVFAAGLLLFAAWYADFDWLFEGGTMLTVEFLWEPRGLIVGIGVISAIVLVLRGGASGNEILEGDFSSGVQTNR